MFSGSLEGARAATASNLSGGSVHQVGCLRASWVAMGMAPRSRIERVMLCHRSSHTALRAAWAHLNTWAGQGCKWLGYLCILKSL